MSDTDLVSDVGNSDVIAATTKREIEAFGNFKQFYKTVFPYPTAAAVRVRDVLGWKIYAAIAQNVFAIALAAMRTADMFYRVAVSSSPVLATAEAVAAVGAVEGGVVIFAAIRAEMQNRVNDEGIKVHAAAWQLWLGEILGIAISVVAGLGLTFNGLGNVQKFTFSWWLGVIIGAGASLIAAISGEIIGSTLASLSNAGASAARAFKQEVAIWDEGLYKKWKSSDEYKIARGDIRQASSNLPVRGTRPVAKRQERVHGGNGNNAVRQAIYDLLDQHIEKHPEIEQIPGPTEIS